MTTQEAFYLENAPIIEVILDIDCDQPFLSTPIRRGIAAGRYGRCLSKYGVTVGSGAANLPAQWAAGASAPPREFLFSGSTSPSKAPKPEETTAILAHAIPEAVFSFITRTPK